MVWFVWMGAALHVTFDAARHVSTAVCSSLFHESGIEKAHFENDKHIRGCHPISGSINKLARQAGAFACPVRREGFILHGSMFSMVGQCEDSFYQCVEFMVRPVVVF